MNSSLDIKKICNKNKIKVIIAMATPVIMENILQVLLGTTDTFFASRLNENAIAGIGVTNLIMNIYIAFFTAIGVGTTAIVARSIGQGEKEKAVDAVKQSIILTLFISIIIGIISLIFAEDILLILGAEKEVLKYAYPYFLIVSVPCVFLCLMLTLSSALRGSGNTKIPMVASLIANLINIVLNYVLMFGVFNFKGLGIVGAALATTIARVVGVIILLVALCKGKSKIKLSLFEKWSLNKSLLLAISRIGIPAGIEKLIMRLGQLLYGSMIISLGTSSYVAHNIAGTIESYSYLPAMGFGVVAATMVGQSLGKCNAKEARDYGILCNIISTIFMVCVGIIFYIFAPAFARAFTGDKEVQYLVVSVLRLIALFQPFLSLTMVISSALQGAGDTKFPMYSTLIGIWGVRVLIGYILAVVFELGLVGVWMAYCLDVILRGIILLVRFMKGKWSKIEINI